MVNPDSRELLRNLDIISKYLPAQMTIESILAEGGQGVIYRGKVGTDAAAIKAYFPGQVQKRIEREISALRSLKCPNIVGLLWAGEVRLNNSERLDLVATELIPGSDLRKILQDHTMTFEEIGAVAYDLANAIAALWERRIVHRDLKPSNILITNAGRACVVDLGLARYVDLSSLTPQGASWGTYGYLSPEQAKLVRQLTCKSDVYALGVIILQAVIGEHPTNKDQQLLNSSRFHEELPEILEAWEFGPIVKRMLHPRPTARPMPLEILSVLNEFKPS